VPDPEAILTPDLIPDTGRQVFSENFSIPGVWFTHDHDDFTIEYTNGRYRISNEVENLHVSSIRTFDFTDVHAEVDATLVGGPQSGYYGVVCRWQDINNFYAMAIGGDGSANIVRIQNGVPTFLNEGDQDINPQAWNRVGANCTGDLLTLYLNGEPVLQARDDTFDEGYFGLMVGTRGDSGVDVHFDNMTAYIPR
jgi:hypothetical protein